MTTYEEIGLLTELYENKDLYNVIMNTIANESFKDFNRSISTTNVV